MEKPTQETAIALLQQSMTTLTATLTRVELKIDKIEESSRNYLTADEIKANFTSKETFDSLKEKVSLLFKILYGVLAAIGIEALHILTQVLGKK